LTGPVIRFPQPSDRVVLYDGACNLCNNAVNFILDHDEKEAFRFAALQSEAGHALLRKVRIVWV